LVLVVLAEQLDKVAQQVAEQMVATQYFPLLHLLVVVVVVLALVKLEKQVALVVAVVIVVTLVVLAIPHQHLQAKATMAVRQMPHIMVAVAAAVHLP
jgi:hypothetical protein